MGLPLQNNTRLSQSSPLAGIWSNSWVHSNQYPGWFTAQLQSYCQNKYSVYSTETSYTETFYKYCLSLFPFGEPQQRYLPTQHCCCLRAFPQSSLVGIAPNLPEKRRLFAWHSFLGAFFTMKHLRSITVWLLGSCHRCLQDWGGKRELQHVVQKQIEDTKCGPAASLMLGQKKHWGSKIVSETILYHFNSWILVY